MPRLLELDADGRPAVVDDRWHWVEAKDAALADLPAGDVIVPLPLWLAEADALRARDGAVGVWLDVDEEAETLDGALDGLGLIGLHFPVFTDGRNLSNAVLLRARLGWTGPLRALGDVQRDQLSYMRRAGIDSFAVRGDLDPEAAAAGLHVMSTYYQGDVHEPRPLHRRAERRA
jgi:uncharacterized protein (DUF934 family)